jgi:hypothetical protein
LPAQEDRPKPFLVVEVETRLYRFDTDGDGCADAIGFVSDHIDPADFYPDIVDDEEGHCYAGRVG